MKIMKYVLAAVFVIAVIALTMRVGFLRKLVSPAAAA